MVFKIARDTNILMYLIETSETAKRKIAEKILREKTVISSQVEYELINVVSRKLKTSKTEILYKCIQIISICEIMLVNLETLYKANHLIEKYQFQIFDAIIVASVLEAKYDILYSEDLKHNQLIDSKLRIINPFI